MSELPPATRGADERFPPKRTGQTTGGVITVSPVTGVASEIDILGPNFAGGAYYSFQASGADVFIWFKDATSAPTITTAAGLRLIDGARPEEFWLTADARFLENIGSASGGLRWWRSSPNYRDRL